MPHDDLNAMPAAITPEDLEAASTLMSFRQATSPHVPIPANTMSTPPQGIRAMAIPEPASPVSPTPARAPRHKQYMTARQLELLNFAMTPSQFTVDLINRKIAVTKAMGVNADTMEAFLYLVSNAWDTEAAKKQWQEDLPERSRSSASTKKKQTKSAKTPSGRLRSWHPLEVRWLRNRYSMPPNDVPVFAAITLDFNEMFHGCYLPGNREPCKLRSQPAVASFINRTWIVNAGDDKNAGGALKNRIAKRETRIRRLQEEKAVWDREGGVPSAALQAKLETVQDEDEDELEDELESSDVVGSEDETEIEDVDGDEHEDEDDYEDDLGSEDED